MSALQVDVHQGLGELAGEWDDLAEELDAWPCAHPGWIEAWWEAFGAGRLEVLAAREGGRLAGVLPVAGRRGNLRSPTNWHTSTFTVLARSEDAAVALAERVLARRPPALRLAFLDPTDRFLWPLRERAAWADYRVSTATLLWSPYLEVEGDWSGGWRHWGSPRPQRSAAGAGGSRSEGRSPLR